MSSADPDDAGFVQAWDGAGAWLDQARWLYEQECRRLDGARARATTMLGFAGGVLAILARITFPSDGHPGLADRVGAIAAIAAAVTIALSAVAFAFVLSNVLVTRPSHVALLGEWQSWRSEASRQDGEPKRRVFVQRDFTNSLLRAESRDSDSAVATASRAATSRLAALSIGSVLFAGGLIELAVSVVSLLFGGLN